MIGQFRDSLLTADQVLPIVNNDIIIQYYDIITITYNIFNTCLVFLPVSLFKQEHNLQSSSMWGKTGLVHSIFQAVLMNYGMHCILMHCNHMHGNLQLWSIWRAIKITASFINLQVYLKYADSLSQSIPTIVLKDLAMLIELLGWLQHNFDADRSLHESEVADY